MLAGIMNTKKTKSTGERTSNSAPTNPSPSTPAKPFPKVHYIHCVPCFSLSSLQNISADQILNAPRRINSRPEGCEFPPFYFVQTGKGIRVFQRNYKTADAASTAAMHALRVLGKRVRDFAPGLPWLSGEFAEEHLNSAGSPSTPPLPEQLKLSI